MKWHLDFYKVSTYQVWAQGSLAVDLSSRWIWNFWTPVIPSSAEKPCKGTFEVPETDKFYLDGLKIEINTTRVHWLSGTQAYQWRIARTLPDELDQMSAGHARTTVFEWSVLDTCGILCFAASRRCLHSVSLDIANKIQSIKYLG